MPTAWQLRLSKYLGLARSAHESGNKKLEENTLKEWVGVAKADLSTEQLVRTLTFIYTEIRPNQKALDFLFDTYYTKVD